MPRRFEWFVGIDWSGALGPRQKGIALAIAHVDGGPPVLMKRDIPWGREDVLAILADALPVNSLVGLDFGISLPFADVGAFFPGWPQSPPDARALWAMVDEICGADPHLSANSFVDHPDLSAYFRRHSGREGARFHLPGVSHRRGRFRVTEHAQAAMGCKPYSNFNLVGAAQVGKSSLTGMRMLNRLANMLPVWPIDPRPASGSVIVEIYTALASVEAGRTAARSKITDFNALSSALAALDSPPVAGKDAIDDHSADALIVAAWLRRAAEQEDLWNPAGLTPEVARTEGWTFGAR